MPTLTFFLFFFFWRFLVVSTVYFRFVMLCWTQLSRNIYHFTHWRSLTLKSLAKLLKWLNNRQHRAWSVCVRVAARTKTELAVASCRLFKTTYVLLSDNFELKCITDIFSKTCLFLKQVVLTSKCTKSDWQRKKSNLGHFSVCTLWYM